jgi:CarD family transcriptional regulator
MDVEHRELVEGFEHYFVVELLADGSTLYIPMCMMDALGMRPVMSQARLARVLETLRGVPHQLSKDFRKRQERIRTKLATARPVKVAEVVRDLTFRRKQKHLTKVDKRLLNRGRELLAAEMAAATDTKILDAHGTISTALRGAP